MNRLMSRRRYLVASSSVGVGATVLSACAGTPAAAPSESPAKPKTAVTPIRIWFHWSGTEGDLAQKFVDQYNEGQGKQDKNQVEIEQVPPQQMLEKMTTVVVGGDPPDIWSSGSSVKEMSTAGLIVPLPKAEAAFVKDTYIPGAVDASTLKGEVWGFPTEWQAPAFFYRKTHWNEAGLSAPPVSTDDVTLQAAKVTRKNGDQYERFGFGLNWKHPYLYNHLPTLIARFGGQMFTFSGDKPTKVDVASTQALEAVGWWVDMVKNGYTNVEQMDYRGALQQGYLSSAEHGVYFPILNLKNKGLEDIYQDLGATPLVPKKGQKPIAYASGWGIYPTKGAKQPDERYKFMRWAVSKPDMPIIRFVVEQIGALPSVKDYGDKIQGWSPDMIRAYAVETPKITQAHPGLRIISDDQLQKATMDVLPDIITGKLGLRTTLQQLNGTLNEILVRNNP